MDATARSREVPPGSAAAALRRIAIGTLAFLTVVDLFAVQAILPALTRHYVVTPAMMSFAVNASTIGMAAGGLGVALLGRRIDRRRGTVACLACLAVPTLLLSTLPELETFTALRVVQGVLMASAFTLTLAYLGEQPAERGTAALFAAYVTGNVASNLVGRLLSAGVADHLGLAANFYAFALLNLAGAGLALAVLRQSSAQAMPGMGGWTEHLRDPTLLAGFGIGFCILFAFIGIFTFVNFVLVRPPLSLDMMQVGLVYVVFLPSIVTTPLAGLAIQRLGLRPSLLSALLTALAGLPFLLVPSLSFLLAGLVLVGIGTFFAQALATGAVSRAAPSNRGAASGLYLASYFLGGLAGSVILGQVFDRSGWPACVAGVAASIVLACLLVPYVKAAQIAPRRLSPPDATLNT